MFIFHVKINKDDREYKSDFKTVHQAIDQIRIDIKAEYGKKIRFHIYDIKTIK
ncbi:hypothetical protein N356_gp020 [Cellulophaga phage phi14:2]|uniref:Uncharacterized protein n=1 Tax=Cellulophaga phage phi14:2 TaxID=1327990 RepID=S0A392_9CAUD|nr:hypothetical protein N356_gp020 [Cellulophaga phage phi14:2]AGO48912.1 hypothetical protein Phi14:2_gp034 [Cellulophaga phage phi14:2]